MTDLPADDPWSPGSQDCLKPGLPHFCSFLVLSLVGTIVGTLGLVSSSSNPNLSNCWPAMTLQAAGGIWFGGWGVLSAGIFGVVSELLNHGNTFFTLAFIPVNLVQGFLPAWAFRHWRIHPSLPRPRDLGFFVFWCAILTNLVSASLLALVQVGSGRLPVSSLGSLYLEWMVGNALPCLVLGIPLLRAVSPHLVGSPFFCKGWWGGSPPLRTHLRLRNWTVAARLLMDFAVAGVVPILIVCIAESLTLESDRLPNAPLISLMFNASVFLCLIVSGFAAQKLKARVGQLAEGANRLGEGDLSYRIQDMGENELGMLGRSFNDMAHRLELLRRDLDRSVADRERTRREIEIAWEIQRSFLPKAPPDLPGVGFSARMEPAQVVGGDFYDFIPLAGGRWGLVIADVTGKGVPAALFMAIARSLVRVYSTVHESPADLVGAVNEFVSRDNSTATFVTLFLAVLNPAAGTLTYVNAGHDPPLFLPRGEKVPRLLKATGTPLGVLDGTVYEEKKIQVGTGDLLLLYTDGVTEAMNSTQELFGRQRLEKLVSESGGAGAAYVLERIEDEVRSFVAGEPQADDLTLVVAKWQAPQEVQT
jgi:serine phosphatase RsbU (regulator of sigma subunit)